MHRMATPSPAAPTAAWRRIGAATDDGVLCVCVCDDDEVMRVRTVRWGGGRRCDDDDDLTTGREGLLEV
jgi:hypothetical protein